MSLVVSCCCPELRFGKFHHGEPCPILPARFLSSGACIDCGHSPVSRCLATAKDEGACGCATLAVLYALYLQAQGAARSLQVYARDFLSVLKHPNEPEGSLDTAAAILRDLVTVSTTS